MYQNILRQGIHPKLGRGADVLGGVKRVGSRSKYRARPVGKEFRVRTYSTRGLVDEGRRLYLEKGPAYTIYWFLKQVWVRRGHPVKLEDVFRFHKLIAGVRSKNATLKVLKRLELYGIVKNLGYGFYKPVVLDSSIVEGSIDWRRVRTRDQVLRKRGVKGSTSRDVPREVKSVVKVASKLIKAGEKWRAVDLLAHTLLPVRKTGVLLARVGDTFIYYERKTDKLHMVKSPQLAQIFKSLGIVEEVLGRHKLFEADSIIRRMYGSHDIARKLHYLLKEKGWFEYPPPGWFYRVFKDPVTSRLWIDIYVNKGGKLEKIWRIPSSESGEVGLLVKAGAIVTREHVKPENENTYFNRSKGLLP